MPDTAGASNDSIQMATTSYPVGDASAQSITNSTTQHDAATNAAQNDGAPGQDASVPSAPGQNSAADQTTATPTVSTPVGNSRGRISLTVPASTAGGAGGQIRRLDFETLTMHPTETTKVIARIRKEHPSGIPGEFYEQVDEIPILDTAVKSPADPKFYFLPNLTAAKIPPKNRASKKNNYQPILWVRQGDTDTWTRVRKTGGPDEVWRPCPIFRRFNLITDKYEEAYVALPKIKDADPNNTDYAHSYNKWIDQIKRRRDDSYEKVVYKDHWTIPERRALYSAINDYVREKGLRRFGFGDGVTMASADLDKITAAVNAAGATVRKTDAVRGQIHSSHDRKNKAIRELINKAEALRARLRAKEKVPREDRYPQMAIPEDLWPVETSKNKKRKAANVIEDTDSESSNTPETPVDQERPARALKALPKWARKSLGAPGMTPTHKKRKVEDDAGNEVVEDEAGWADTDEYMTDASSVEESGWETEHAEPTEEQLKQEEAREIEAAIESSFHLAAEEHTRRQTCREVVAAIEEDIQERRILSGVASPAKTETNLDDKVNESCSIGTSHASNEQHDHIQAPAATPSPQKKRKRTPEPDASEGSDGDDEAEVASSQSRSFKKMRAGRGS